MISNSRSSVTSIKTFVILDLETTGLFKEDPLNPLNSPPRRTTINRDTRGLLSYHILTTNPRDVPRITEISLLAVSRRQVEEAIKNSQLFIELPLVHSIVRLPCNVHTRQINPELDEAAWNAYELQKTENKVFAYSKSVLEEKNNFATEWQGIYLFLKQLPQPVCIIAHNGIKYDFRILHAELIRTGILQENSLLANMYFVDSYIMFIDLEKMLHDELRMLTQVIDWRFVNTISKEPVKPGDCSTLTEISFGGPCTSTESQPPSENSDEPPMVEELIRMKQYETPKHSIRRALSEPVKLRKRKLTFEISADHPLEYARLSRWSPAKRIRIQPNFFRRTADGDWEFDNFFALQYFTQKKTFQLEEMYWQLTKRKINAHFAQEDCEALLQVCLAYGQDFLNYVDTHAATFPF